MECRSKILFVKEIPIIGEQFEDLFRQQPGFVAMRRKPNFAFVEYKDKDYSSDALDKLQGYKFDPLDKPLIIDYDRGSKDYQDDYYRSIQMRKRDGHRDGGHHHHNHRDMRDIREDRDRRDMPPSRNNRDRELRDRDLREKELMEIRDKEIRDELRDRELRDREFRDRNDNNNIPSSSSSKREDETITTSSIITTESNNKKDMDDDEDFDDEDDDEKSIKHRPRSKSNVISPTNSHNDGGTSTTSSKSHSDSKPSSSYYPSEKKRQRDDYHSGGGSSSGGYYDGPQSRYDDRGSSYKRPSHSDSYDRHYYMTSNREQNHSSPHFNIAYDHYREGSSNGGGGGSGSRREHHNRDSYGYGGSATSDQHLLGAASHPCPTLFVSNLPKDVTEREMSILFRFMRGFIGIRLINKEGKLPICFCDFVDTTSAVMALDMLQGFRMDPKDISSSISIEFDKANTKR